MKASVKALARLVATGLVLPRVIGLRIRATFLGLDAAFADSMQSLSTIPGLRGRYLRAAFLRQVLTDSARDVVIESGTLLSKAGATFGEGAYIGPHCVLGWVHVERNVLIASGVCIPSGSHTHGTDRLDVPIKDQTGHVRAVRIGEGAWIGANAVVMADVGAGTIVGAGAVVLAPLPDRVFAAGVPAKVIKQREAAAGP